MFNLSFLADKTLKREYALILFGVLIWKIIEGDLSMVEVLLMPVMTYIAAVAGIHLMAGRNVHTGV